jgi:hypothetical protein
MMMRIKKNKEIRDYLLFSKVNKYFIKYFNLIYIFVKLNLKISKTNNYINLLFLYSLII